MPYACLLWAPYGVGWPSRLSMLPSTLFGGNDRQVSIFDAPISTSRFVCASASATQICPLYPDAGAWMLLQGIENGLNVHSKVPLFDADGRSISRAPGGRGVHGCAATGEAEVGESEISRVCRVVCSMYDVPVLCTHSTERQASTNLRRRSGPAAALQLSWGTGPLSFLQLTILFFFLALFPWLFSPCVCWFVLSSFLSGWWPGTKPLRVREVIGVSCVPEASPLRGGGPTLSLSRMTPAFRAPGANPSIFFVCGQACHLLLASVLPECSLNLPARE